MLFSLTVSATGCDWHALETASTVGRTIALAISVIAVIAQHKINYTPIRTAALGPRVLAAVRSIFDPSCIPSAARSWPSISLKEQRFTARYKVHRLKILLCRSKY